MKTFCFYATERDRDSNYPIQHIGQEELSTSILGMLDLETLENYPDECSLCESVIDTLAPERDLEHKVYAVIDVTNGSVITTSPDMRSANMTLALTSPRRRVIRELEVSTMTTGSRPPRVYQLFTRMIR